MVPVMGDSIPHSLSIPMVAAKIAKIRLNPSSFFTLTSKP